MACSACRSSQWVHLVGSKRLCGSCYVEFCEREEARVEARRNRQR